MQTYFILDLFCLIARARAFLWIINPSQISAGTQLPQYKNDDDDDDNAADIIASDASDCRRFVTLAWFKPSARLIVWAGLNFQMLCRKQLVWFSMKKHSIYLLDLTP